MPYYEMYLAPQRWETQIYGLLATKNTRQCTYNVTMRRIRVTTVAMEKQ